MSEGWDKSSGSSNSSHRNTLLLLLLLLLNNNNHKCQLSSSYFLPGTIPNSLIVTARDEVRDGGQDKISE